MFPPATRSKNTEKSHSTERVTADKAEKICSARLGKAWESNSSAIHPPSRVRIGRKLKSASATEHPMKNSAGIESENTDTVHADSRFAIPPAAYTAILQRCEELPIPERISAPNSVISMLSTSVPMAYIRTICPSSWQRAAARGINDMKLRSRMRSVSTKTAV